MEVSDPISNLYTQHNEMGVAKKVGVVLLDTAPDVLHETAFHEGKDQCDF